MVASGRKKKPSKKSGTPEESLQRYEDLFEQLHRFTASIEDCDKAIIAAVAIVAETRAKYEDAKEKLRELEQSRDGAKHSLYRFLSPNSSEIFPLLDQMAEADEETHGKNSREWRKEPIAALKLSLPSIKALADCDIVMVGQLQDRVLASKDWWLEIPNISEGGAAAICDQLNNFIFERTQK